MARNSPGTLLAFLLAHVDDEDTGECLIWPFTIHKTTGYGSAKRDGRTIGAHRLMCILANGEPPFPEAEAAHTCGRGKSGCVHPRHLEWTTRAVNHSHKVLHGTDNRGEKHYNTTLTDEQVLKIAADPRPASKVAPEYRTTEKTVYNIRSGVSWSWLTGIQPKRKAA